MSVSIKDKVALVTGANRGIGKAIVESFLQHGARKVYLAVRNPESTAELSQTYGDKVVTLRADMSDAQSLQALAEQAKDVEVLVNNAGVLLPAEPLDEHAEASMTEEFTVNVLGLMRIAKAFAPILEKNHGALVQLNSVASVVNFTFLTTYSASKAAAYFVTQGLREKLRDKGVHVLSVHPGPIATDMAVTAGMEGSPVTVVSEGIVEALARGDFHLFPDETAKQVWAAYQSFAENVVEAPDAAE